MIHKACSKKKANAETLAAANEVESTVATTAISAEDMGEDRGEDRGD